MLQYHYPNFDCIYPSMHGLSNYNFLPGDVTKLLKEMEKPGRFGRMTHDLPPSFSHQKFIVRDNKISISLSY